MEQNANYKMLHRVLAALSFLIIFVIFTMTVQPSVPFWDCGEFLGMMTWQQVPHPPGAPLFSIIGGVVQVILPFGNLGWQGNMMSVVASAFTVMFLYLMVVIVIKNLRKEPIETFVDALAVYGSAFVGSIAFGFSSTFWFNGIESEVYAIGILNVAVVLYLLMRWTEVADEEGNEKYLILSMYLTGLSMGIHLLAMLVLFTLILVVYFRKYEVTIKSFVIMAVIGLLSYEVVISIIAQALPAWLSGHSAGRNEAMEFSIQNSTALRIFTILCIIGIVALFVRSVKKNKAIPALITMSLLSVIFAWSVFAHILIRANANCPMNENAPKDMYSLAAYVGREQYGDAPMWPRRYQTEDYFVRKHNAQDENGNYIYGIWNPPGRKIVSRSDGTQIYALDWNSVNTAGELNYMIKYQGNHMYWRYFLWNFVGRMSDVQDEGVAWFDSKDSPKVKEANYKTGNSDIFPVKYFALPLLFGIIGLFFQFKRDPKFALIFFATFIVTGILTAWFQNQQDPQPRERDYFYVGSFLIWGLWMGLGTYGLIDMLGKKSKSTGVVALVLIASILLVPINMFTGNYPAYGRDGKWLPFDYAYNVLQSCEQDAILFTNGDNDTFPVWYMQDVEGVRRDIRVCNLSLGQTLWYIEQLKNREPWGAKKVALNIPDSQLKGDEMESGKFSYEFGPAKTDVIKVSPDILKYFGCPQDVIDKSEVSITFVGKERKQDDKGNPIYYFGVNDKLIREILIANKFERPVYFINSAGTDAMCGLENYLRMEGFCSRICPVPQQRTPNATTRYNEEIMNKVLLNVNNTDKITKTPKYEVKLRNLNNPSVSYDETDRRQILMTYPRIYIGYAVYLASDKKDYDLAEKVLDTYLQNIPTDKVPIPLELEYRIAEVYKLCGKTEKAKKYIQIALQTAEEQIENPRLEPFMQYELQGRFYGPYHTASDLYVLLGDYDRAKSKLEQLLTAMQPYIAQSQSMGNKDEATQLAYRAASIKLTAELMIVDKNIEAKDYKKAFELISEIEKNYNESQDPFAPYLIGSIAQKKSEIEGLLGVKPSLYDSSVIALR
jgi:tetratricopeptide (TPR) repeat protein